MRTFIKDGETRTAMTPVEAVRLKFDGWRETTREQQQAPAAKPVKRAAKPRRPRKPRTASTK